MKIASMGMHRGLRFSGALLIAGLLIELISLVWEKPLAFLLFAFIGGALFLAGIFLYLYSLVSASG
jgi:uncharacterized membrane protein